MKLQREAGRSLQQNPTRRRFLQFSAATLSTIALSNCARSSLERSSSQQQSPKAGDSKTLSLYTWADYSNNALYQRFESKTGIKVIADVYESNEVMLAKMQAGGGKQYSIVYPSDYMVRQMTGLNLLTPIDHSRLQGLDRLMKRWQNPVYDPGNAHSVPYGWGTTGILYNSKVISSEPKDLNFFWENQQALAGKITLLDDVRETMGAALKSLNYSYNSTNPTEIEAAYKKLLALKPTLAAFKSYGWEDQLIAGDLAACMSYSTLGNLLPKENPQLTFVIPQSGTSVWTDTLAIPNSAPNLEAAYAWINFLLEPESGVFGMEQMNVTTPNQATFDALPAAIKSNPKVFPTDTILAKSEAVTLVGDTIELYDKYWNQLKSA